MEAMRAENADLKAQIQAMSPDAMDDDMYAMDDDDMYAMDDTDPNAYHNPGEKLGGGGTKSGGARARSRVNPRASQPNAPGLAPVAHAARGASAQDPTKEWDSLVESFIAKGNTKAKSVILACKASPTLHQASVAAANASR